MFSLPLWAYRMAMLAWSLRLAFRLLGWLRWCWDGLQGGHDLLKLHSIYEQP
jgi:hypothetical protein